MSMLSTFTGCFRITLRAGRASWAPAAALLIAACACPAAAQDTDADTGQSWMTGSDASGKPRWSAEIMSGRFEPELEDWATFYGDDEMRQLGFGLGYKLLRQVEVGLAVDYMHDQLYPAHLYVLLRGVFFENQWVVPYVGGGLTRAYYRQAVDNQSSVRGKADGDHTRFGLQILLDALDGGNAAGFEEESVDNTYLVIERLSFSAEFDGIELGGDSVRLGLVFEF
jgi:hypothetical protein